MWSGGGLTGESVFWVIGEYQTERAAEQLHSVLIPFVKTNTAESWKNHTVRLNVSETFTDGTGI